VKLIAPPTHALDLQTTQLDTDNHDRERRTVNRERQTPQDMHDKRKDLQPPVPPKRSGGGKIGMTILAASLGFVLVQLDVSIVNIALAKIGADLGTPVAGLQWVVDAYALAFAALLLSAGALGDQIGARKGFNIGFAAFVVASLGCGLAPGPIALIVARTAQGIGAALLVPCSLALLNQAAAGDARLRATAVSLWTASGSVAMAVGPILGGLLVDTLGWRSIFLINIPIGIVGIFLTQLFVQESASRHHTFDPAGQLLAILALLGLVGAVIGSEGTGFSPTVCCALIISVISGVGFVLVESRASRPMLPLDFFRQSRFTAATLVGLAVNFTVYGVIFVLGLYLQRIRGYSPFITGLAFLPFPIALLFSNLSAGSLSKRFNLRYLMVTGLLIGATGYWLLRSLDAGTPYLWMLLGFIVIPLGVGLAVPSMTTALLTTVPASRSGVASGVLNSVRQAGGALGVAVYGALLNERGIGGVQFSFFVSALLLTVAAIVAATWVNRSPDPKI
jgi:MFS transporter, DHA2 family, methylenomycin A resistance protein